MALSRTRYKPAQVVEALHQSKGMVTVAARLLRCDPDTVRNYAKRHASVAETLLEEREGMTDVAELALYKAIQAGEAWAVCFYLKTQGKARGYVERMEHTGRDGGPVEQRTEHSGAVEIHAVDYRHSIKALSPPRDDLEAAG